MDAQPYKRVAQPISFSAMSEMRTGEETQTQAGLLIKGEILFMVPLKFTENKQLGNGETTSKPNGNETILSALSQRDSSKDQFTEVITQFFIFSIHLQLMK